MSIDDILEKIKKENDSIDIIDEYDLKIVNFTHAESAELGENWELEYVSEIEWYKSQGVTDVEDDIICDMISRAKDKYNFKKEFSMSDYVFLDNNLREYYEFE